MRTFRPAGAALMLLVALAVAGMCALDAIQPRAALAAQAFAQEAVAAPAPSAEVGGDALAGPSHGASGDAAAGHGAPGSDAHGEEGGGHDNPVVPVLALLLLIILAAKLGGALMEKFGQPGVLGELVFGVLLGNLALVGFTGVQQLFNTTVFGMVPAEDMIEILGEIGVILLLFEVGLESNIKEMMSVGVSSLLVATFGVIAPFFLGWGVGVWLLPEHSTYVHVFLGATLCATSVGITARVLKDLGKITLRESKIILGAAVIDDVMGLVILAVVSGIIMAAGAGNEGGVSIGAVAWIVGKALLFLVGAVVVGQWASPRIFKLASKLRGQHLLLTTALVILFSLSYLANKIGLATIVGAFAAGLILDEVHYGELKEREKHTLEELLHPLAGFLVPIFFVHMGYKVKLIYFGQTEILLLAAGLTVAAILGKQVCSFGVMEKGLDRLSVGFGMIPRGEVGLIFASIGTGLAVAGERIIDDATYGAVVIMVIVTTLITPPALKWSLGRARGGYEGASDEEMRRIANERRERRKEYYRQRARDEGREDEDRDQGRRRRRGGSGRGGRGQSGGGERAAQSGRQGAGGRGDSRGDGPRAEGEGDAARRRRRRPRRRRGGGGGSGGGGGGERGGGGGSESQSRGQSSPSSERKPVGVESRRLNYADST